ncbi:MAG: YdcF family protein [Chloroflexi bacterium]|nr:YdcF family protein [Chloroflexota bacterium]
MLPHLLRAPVVIIFLLALTLGLPRVVTAVFASSRVKTAAVVDPSPVAIVFGAGLRRDGMPSSVLRDRVATASDLYLSGKVGMLLMSGQSPEPAAMRDFALGLGVPDIDILLDNGGLRTYDSCYRAVQTFGIDEAILVTQGFHLPRALYVCNALGISAQGVAADNYRYRGSAQVIWNIRETLATLVALWDVHFAKPVPAIIAMKAIIYQE